jgi:hypothetical protein
VWQAGVTEGATRLMWHEYVHQHDGNLPGVTEGVMGGFFQGGVRIAERSFFTEMGGLGSL